jgi:hypothetical protein
MWALTLLIAAVIVVWVERRKALARPGPSLLASDEVFGTLLLFGAAFLCLVLAVCAALSLVALVGGL